MILRAAADSWTALAAADISVSEVSVASSSGGGLGCQYRLRLRFFPLDRIPAAAQLTFAELEATFNQAFIPALQVPCCSQPGCTHQCHPVRASNIYEATLLKL